MRYTPYLKKCVKLFNKNNIMPEYVTFFVTNKCNARCGYCFYWKELNSLLNELTLREIEKISKAMSDFLYLLLTGGEPFLREDLTEIVKIFYKNNNAKKISIVTNGAFPDKIHDSMKRIMTECLHAYITLFVSLDGIGDAHDKIRGVKGLYENALETIRGVKEIQNVYPKLSLGVTMVYSSYNKDMIIDVYNNIKTSIKPDIINCNFVRGNARNAETKTCDIKNFIKVQKMIENDLIRCQLRGVFDPIIGNLVAACKFESISQLIKIVQENRYLSPCYAGRINVVIYPNGDVFPCELLSEKMGNLRESDYNFKKIWFSEKSRQIRKTIDENKCYCTHECYLLPNVMFNPRFLLKIFRNYLRLTFRI